MPAHHGHARQDGAALPGDVQLPVHAGARPGEGAAVQRRDRRRHVGRLSLAARHPPRRRLLPPLAQPEEVFGRPHGPQGDASLRPRELVAVGDAGQRARVRAARLLHAGDGEAAGPRQPPRTLPHLPGEEEVLVRAGPCEGSEAQVALPRSGETRRLLPRPLRVPSRDRYRGQHERGGQLRQRRDPLLFAERGVALGGLRGDVQRHEGTSRAQGRGPAKLRVRERATCPAR